MAHYLIVSGGDVIVHKTEAKSIAEAVDSVSQTDYRTLDVYRVVGPPHRVSIVEETTRRLVIEAVE